MALKEILVTNILVVIFGTGAWVAINGIFVELPVLVQNLPEGWMLPTFLVMATQLGNIGPIIFSLLKYMIKSVNENHAIYSIVVVGSISSLIMIFFWNQTAYVSGEEHSIALLSIVFCLAVCSCTAAVTYPMFISVFANIYIVALMLGEGLGSLLPSITVAIQGIEDTQCVNTSSPTTNANNTTILIYKVKEVVPEPKFPVSTFFIVQLMLLLLSFFAFFMLKYMASKKCQKLNVSETEPKATPSQESSLLSKEPTITMKTKLFLLFLQGWIAGMSNSSLPSIQSYSCLPYGSETYHIAAIANMIASPVGTITAYVIKPKRSIAIGILSLIATLFAAYIVIVALLSPEPPLATDTLGSVFVVGSWLLFSYICSYVKVCIASILRIYGKQHLYWWGIATQIGSGTGALIMFLLVEVAKVFHSMDSCST